MRLPVDDPDDPRLAQYLGLRDHQLRMPRERPGGDMAGVFMAEGDLVVVRALRAGYELLSMLIDARRTQPLPGEIPDTVPLYAAGPDVLQRITGYHMHRGVIACFARRPVPSPDEVLAGKRRIVVVENTNNPTNLGVIARSAVGLGMDALALDPTSSDPLYRRASRVSMGEVFALPHTWLPPFPGGLELVRSLGFTLVALTPDPTAPAIDAFAPGPDARLALVLGAEGPGLTDTSLAMVDHRLRIPMYGAVDSLNLGAAAAIACYVLGRDF